MLLGVLADSHGLPRKLRDGIGFLESFGAEKIVHLGDMVDTLRVETVDECVSLLIEHEIAGVMGNHEYSLVMHHFKRYPERFSEQTKDYIRSLPWRLEMEEVCLTHFSPLGGVYGLFAATDETSYEETIRASSWPVIINGHSHDPRICRQSDGVVESIRCSPGSRFQLDPGLRYVLTCGALEDSYCALYDFSEHAFYVVLMNT